jgi:sec-independent protein translocase protein TatC
MSTIQDDKKLTLAQHLIELKQRLIYCLLAFLIFFAVGYYFSTNIYNFLLEPLANQYGGKIIYTNLTEAFFTYLKLSMLTALFLALPFIALQIYLFTAPALYKKEKKFILAILVFCPLLFAIGAILVYYLVLPMAFKFLLSFQNLNPIENLPIELQAKISEYLSLITQLIFAFGIAFQLPIILVFLVKFGVLTIEGLRKNRKYWIVIIFFIAAIITPPDVLSQIALALPLLLLYEIAIIVSSKLIKKPNNKNAK